MLQLLLEVQYNSIVPHAISYSVTISAYERGLQPQYALLHLQEMRYNGTCPASSATTQSAATCAAAVDGSMHSWLAGPPTPAKSAQDAKLSEAKHTLVPLWKSHRGK